MRPRAVLFAVSFLVFFISLGFPAFYGEDSREMLGLNCLLGSVVAWVAYPEAFANFLYLIWLIGLACRIIHPFRRMAEPVALTSLAFFAFLLTLIFLTRTEIGTGAGGKDEEITAIGLGFYLWSGSMLIAALGSAGLFVTARREGFAA